MHVPAFHEQRRGLELVRQLIRQRLARDAHGQVRAQVRHQVAADPLVPRRALEREQRESCVLDRTQCQHDDAFWRHRHVALVRPHLHHAPVRRDELRHVALRNQHEPLLHVVTTRFHLRGAQRADRERHGAELVQREEARARRLPLHGERRLQLHRVLFRCRHVLELERQLGQRNRPRDLARFDRLVQPLPQRPVQRAEDELVRSRRADQLGCLPQVAVRAPQVRDDLLRPAVLGQFGRQGLG